MEVPIPVANCFFQTEVDRPISETPGLRGSDRLLERLGRQAVLQTEALREVEHIGGATGTEIDDRAEPGIPGQSDDSARDDPIALGSGHLVRGYAAAEG